MKRPNPFVIETKIKKSRFYPKRIVTQSWKEIICTYATFCNFLQEIPEQFQGGYNSFVKVFFQNRGPYIEEKAKRDVENIQKRREKILKKPFDDLGNLISLPKQITYLEAYKTLRSFYENERGLTSGALSFMFGQYSNFHPQRVSDILSINNGYISFYAKIAQSKYPFFHVVAIKHGYVIDSIKDISNEGGVYLWEGQLKGYTKTTINEGVELHKKKTPNFGIGIFKPIAEFVEEIL